MVEARAGQSMMSRIKEFIATDLLMPVAPTTDRASLLHRATGAPWHPIIVLATVFVAFSSPPRCCSGSDTRRSDRPRTDPAAFILTAQFPAMVRACRQPGPIGVCKWRQPACIDWGRYARRRPAWPRSPRLRSSPHAEAAAGAPTRLIPTPVPTPEPAARRRRPHPAPSR